MPPMQVDHRAKLIMHRMIARRLDADAVAAARTWNAHVDDGRYCRQEWRDLLALPLDQLRRKLTERTEEMTRLRLSSPFPATCDFTDETLRRRIWRLAKRQQDLDMAQIYDDLMDVDVDIAS